MGSSSAIAMRKLYSLALVFFICVGRIQSFTFQAEVSHRRSCSVSPLLDNDNSFSGEGISRREAGQLAIGGALATAGWLTSSPVVHADEGFRPAKRPFAYRVDSTQPPTLIPISNAQSEMKILQDLGKGLGTKKEAIVNDSINLNNILNKAVFGTIDAISSLTQGGDGKVISGPGFASFVCLGLPTDASPADVGLAKDLIDPILRSQSPGGETSLGLWFFPLTTQASLDSYIETGDLVTLVSSLRDKGVSETTIDLYRPLLEYSHAKSLKLLALSPEQEDIRIARAKGLQYVDADRRTTYVVDPNGFIALSQQPRFRVYADRSLLKDYEALNNEDSAGLFFAERILVHETAAGVAAQYAVQRPDSLVILVAPTRDLRFLQGINGRIPRLCAFLNPETNKVTDNAVTTILLNPCAKETLSKTNYLRLEIGTGPETLDYQSKVADYLWFSAMPKVNMIPRLMNG